MACTGYDIYKVYTLAWVINTTFPILCKGCLYKKAMKLDREHRGVFSHGNISSFTFFNPQKTGK